MAVAGLLDAAEGEMDFGSDGGGVDVGDAGFEVAHGAEGAVDVVRVEGGGEAVLDAVGDIDGVVEVCALEDADHRSEDFFLGDAHAGFDFGEDGGGEEV